MNTCKRCNGLGYIADYSGETVCEDGVVRNDMTIKDKPCPECSEKEKVRKD